MKRIVIHLFAMCLLIGRHNANALQTHVVLDQNETNFEYTVYNDEAADSSLFLSNIHLELNAPFDVVSSPVGWNFVTDHFSYVDWFCTDSTSPYPNDVAPGTSRGGFVIHSGVTNSAVLVYDLVSWQHGTTNSGPSVQGSVGAPSIDSLDATLRSASYSVSNTFQFTVSGIPLYVYTVQYSSNLVDWVTIETNVSPYSFVETNTVLYSRRFYRAVTAFDPSVFFAD